MRIVLLLFVIAGCTSTPPPVEPAPGNARPPHELTTAERIDLARRMHQRGRGHERIDSLEGTWEVEVTSQDADGSNVRPAGRGLGKIEWTMGRRFLRWDLELDVSGETHHVNGFLGYDVVVQEYQALWISELATGMSLARGDGDPEGRGIVLQVRPTGDEVGGARSLLRILDVDHFVIESIAVDSKGEEGVVQRASYVRVRP